jgi:hypothetical protein
LWVLAAQLTPPENVGSRTVLRLCVVRVRWASMTPFLLAFVLSQAVVPAAASVPAPQLFEAALRLNGPERAEAVKKLRADPRASARVLSWLARAEGVSTLQAPIRDSLGCHALMTGFRAGGEPPANAAAALLMTLAKEDENVRLDLARSGNALDKFVAVMSVWEDQAALEKLAGQLESVALQGEEGQVLVGLRLCLMQQSGRSPASAARSAVLRKLPKATTTRASCTDADAAAALATRQSVTWHGSSSDNKNVTFMLDADGVIIDANDVCLLSLAREQQKQGKASPRFIVAVADMHTPLEPEALTLLEQQLRDYSKEERPNAVRTLLGRGKALNLLSEFDERQIREDDGLLKAAVLAGKPYAAEAVIARVSCPFGSESVPLLTTLQNKSLATTEATRLATTCTRSRGAAVLVLLDLGAPNWPAQVPRALADPFAKGDLERGLETRWSPKTKSALLQLPSGDEAFKAWRDDLVKRFDTKR